MRVGELYDSGGYISFNLRNSCIMAIFSKGLKNILLIVLGILISQTVFASSDDDYLRQLELEAGDEIDDMTEDSNSSDALSVGAPASENELILDKKKLIVDINTFESALKNAYPDSYALYDQLNEEQRKLIYQGFTEHKRLYNSSLKVISIYLGSH